MARKYKCGKCGRKGHNKATCSSRNKKKTIRRKTAKKKTRSKTKKVKKKAKKKVSKTGRTMGRSEKIKRWGKVVARYKSKTTDATYRVRRKGTSYSCNCPGWRFKKKGRGRYCRHVTMARGTGKKRYHRRSRFCRR